MKNKINLTTTYSNKSNKWITNVEIGGIGVQIDYPVKPTRKQINKMKKFVKWGKSNKYSFWGCDFHSWCKGVSE